MFFSRKFIDPNTRNEILSKYVVEKVWSVHLAFSNRENRSVENVQGIFQSEMQPNTWNFCFQLWNSIFKFLKRSNFVFVTLLTFKGMLEKCVDWSFQLLDWVYWLLLATGDENSDFSSSLYCRNWISDYVGCFVSVNCHVTRRQSRF